MATAGRVRLDDVAVVDNHCHPLLADRLEDPAAWRACLTEAADPGDVTSTALYRRVVRRLAAFLGTEPVESEVVAARARISGDELVRRLFVDARIAAVVVDAGYPPSGEVVGGAALASLTGCGHAELLRLEPLFERLICAHPSLDLVIDALHEELRDLRGAGYAGLKSVAGYRTGLDIGRPEYSEALAAFARARAEAVESGAVRLGHKPLLDTLLHIALAHAAAGEAPFQFHVGYGDTDVDLRLANPLHLRGLFEDPAYRRVPIVTLHGSWPYFREAAFLAALYPNAFLDLSYGAPFLGLAEHRSVTSAALGAAPWSKLMYSSDGSRVPELHWIAAHDGRDVLGACLGLVVDDGELTVAEAEEVGRRILAGNAARLYGLGC